jgi:hypothetical protein
VVIVEFCAYDFSSNYWEIDSFRIVKDRRANNGSARGAHLSRSSFIVRDVRLPLRGIPEGAMASPCLDAHQCRGKLIEFLAGVVES